MASSRIVQVGEDFWNLRGSLRVLGVLPVGTQASLVRRKNGKYLLLDACRLEPEMRSFIDRETSSGDAIEAVLHLHPFHTLFVRPLHEAYPQAKLYGTARHHARAPDLPWQPERTDQPALHELFAEDLDFSVPRGVELIPAAEHLHFSSVLAFHSRSRTLHVDDTLNYVRLPPLLRMLKPGVLDLHPSLAKVLERRRGAAADFRAWGRALCQRLATIDNLCAAHVSVLLGREYQGPPLAERVERVLRAAEPKLAAHERRFG